MIASIALNETRHTVMEALKGGMRWSSFRDGIKKAIK